MGQSLYFLACELLKDLVMHEEVRHPLLIGLVGLLKPSVDDSTLQAGNRISES